MFDCTAWLTRARRLLGWLDRSGLQGVCLLCRQPSSQPLLCAHCAAVLPRLEQPCERCGHPVPTVGDHLCGQCLRQPPPWDRLFALADYGFPYRSLIHQLKYGHQPLPALLMGRQMAASLPTPPWPEVLLPVPLHWWRAWRRGYNQAEELARALGQASGIPVDARLLRRVRATASQTQLSRRERRRNLARAFVVGEHGYRHVALVDDVVTTGSTAAVLTGLLRDSGVDTVEVWAVCRTLSQRLGSIQSAPSRV